MKFKSDIELQAGLKDGSNDIGTAGQILSSTGSQTNWIDQSSIVASEAKLVFIECKNTSGGTISKGTPVYQTGTVGATDVIEIDAADASDEDKMAAIGLLQTDLANNAFGKVVITGELLNITTSPIDGVTPVTGDTIYVKSGGGLTLTKPTGVNFIQNIGLVGKVSGGNAGSITVSSIMRSNDVPTPLYIDHTNQRLGIGTTSPSAKLEVNGQTVINSTGLTEGFQWFNDTNEIFSLEDTSGAGELLLLSSNSVKVKLNANGTSYFNGGNVGIGTTNPSTKLQISTTMSSTPTSNIFLDVDGSNVNGGGGSIIFNTSASAGTASGYNAKITGTREGGGTGGDSRLGFWTTLVSSSTAPQERMTITKEGNVGIGTTSPRTKMHVDSSTAFSLTDGSADTLLLTNDSTVSAIGAIGPSIGFGNMNNNNRTSAIAAVRTGGDHDNMGLAFFTHPSDSGDETVVQKMTITHEGNVGIGTTSPGQKLDVNGNANIDGTLFVNTTNNHIRLVDTDNTGNFSVGVNTNFQIRDITANTTPLTIRAGTPGNTILTTSSGRVGIGLSSPGVTLHVNGFARLNGGLQMNATNATIYQILDSALRFGTNNTERMRIDNTGNVGIGTTSPSFPLHVNTSNDIVGYFKSTDNKASIIIADNDTTGFVSAENDRVSIGYGSGVSTSNITILNGTYNVGIGTTSPSAKLHVTDGSGGDIAIGTNTTAVKYLNFGVNSDYSIQSNGGTYLRFHTEGSERMRITSAGNVGIGTTSPRTKLHITGLSGDDDPTLGSSTAPFFVSNTANSYGLNIGVDVNGTSWLQSQSNTSATAYKMSLNPLGGNVGIGTTSPDKLLVVEGTSAEIVINDTDSTDTPRLRFRETGTTSGSIITDASNMIFQAGTNERMRITSSGYVGIGYTSPNAKLAVNGDFGVQGQLFTNTGIAAATGSGVANGFAIPYRLGITTLNSNYNYIVRLTTTGTGTDSGSYYLVGYDVGTSSFYTRMVSRGGDFSNHPQLAISGNTMVAYHTHASSYNIRWSCETIGTGDPDGTLHNMGADYQWQRDINDLYYTDGNVGIGTDSPSRKLEVDFTGSVYGAKFTRSDATGSSLIEFANSAGVKSIIGYDSGVDGYKIGTASATNLVVKQNGNVGIGYTNPTQKLSVNGNILVNNSIYGTGTTHTYYQIANSDYHHSFYTRTNSGASLERFTIEGGAVSGNAYFLNTNVGIGTTSPSTKLMLEHNNDGAVGGTIRIRDRDSQQSANQLTGAIEFESEDATTPTSGVSTAIKAFAASATGGSYLTISTTDVSTSTLDERMRIGSSGNVGIGTTSPSQKLEVDGAVKVTNNFTSETSANSGYFDFVSTTSTTRITTKGNDDSTLGKFQILQQASDGSPSNTPFYIDSDSNVGIGTTSPDVKLQINHTGGNNGIRIISPNDVNGFLQFGDSDDDNVGRIVYGHSNDSMQFVTNDAEAMRINSSGNVGIGTTNPSAKLDIINSGLSTMFRVSNTIANATTKYGSILGRHYTNSEENVTGMLITSSSSSTGGTVSIGGGISAANAVNNVIFYTAVNNTTLRGTERMRINPSGNVGIGTTSPGAKLEVSSSGADGVLISKDKGTTSNSGRLFFETDTVSEGFSFLNSNGLMTIRSQAQAGATSGNVRVAINGSGNVGIGTTSPGNPLHVYDSDNILATFESTDSVSEIRIKDDTKYTRLLTAGADFKIMPNDGVEMAVFEGDTGRTLFNGGNVGIGTTSPAASLQIGSAVATSSEKLDVRGNSSGNYVASFEQDHATGYGVLIDTDGTLVSEPVLKIKNSSSELFYVGSNGNVGIGTTTPGDKLHVNGTVRSQAPATSDWGFIGFNSAGTASSGLWFDGGSADILLRRSDNSLQGRLRSGGSSYLNGGNFGLGTTSPAQKLTVNSGRVLISNTTTPIYIKAGSNYKSWVHHIGGNDGYIFAPSTADNGETWDWANQTKLGANGVVTAKNFQLSSDKRFKNNIEDIKDIKVEAAFKSFEMESSPGEKRYGVVAQELEKTNPELVETDHEGFKSVKYIDLLIAKIAELEARLEKLEK